MPDPRRVLLWLGLAAAACTPLGGSPPVPSSTTALGVCRPTLAFQRPPDEVADFFRAGANPTVSREEWLDAAKRTNWAGGGGIWIPLPNDGIVNWGTATSPSKFPIYATTAGRATATARLLNGSTPPGFKASFDGRDEGGGPGFMATGLTFPANGCWEVTYTVGPGKVAFVVDVRR